mmetsp:Transcript_57945/g.114928  ORF Transcript_57945/g.114928 Transcript_57945/m.114928 type:complete len:114 (+) Transcript_57945:247-588(+)
MQRCGVAARGATRSMAHDPAGTDADPVLEERGGDGLSPCCLCPELGGAVGAVGADGAVGAHLLLPVSLVGLAAAFTVGDSSKFVQLEKGLCEVRLVPTVGSDGEDAKPSKCTD